MHELFCIFTFLNNLTTSFYFYLLVKCCFCLFLFVFLYQFPSCFFFKIKLQGARAVSHNIICAFFVVYEKSLQITFSITFSLSQPHILLIETQKKTAKQLLTPWEALTIFLCSNSFVTNGIHKKTHTHRIS